LDPHLLARIDKLNEEWHNKLTLDLMRVPIRELEPMIDVLELNCPMVNATMFTVQDLLWKMPINRSNGPDPAHDVDPGRYEPEDDEEKESSSDDYYTPPVFTDVPPKVGEKRGRK
jgi:hypothetical protein